MDKTFKIWDKIVVWECDYDEWRSSGVLQEHNRSWKWCKWKIVSIGSRSVGGTITYRCKIVDDTWFEMVSSFTSNELIMMKPKYTFNIKIK